MQDFKHFDPKQAAMDEARGLLEAAARAAMADGSLPEKELPAFVVEVPNDVNDQLEYYDVQLGMGALCIYPKPGTTCLVGIIEGQETDAFLISADEVDEIVLNGGTLGGLVKVGELTERLNLIEKDINSLKQKLSGWTPVPNDGGSALKTALSSYISESLKETQVRDIENERVKQ